MAKEMNFRTKVQAICTLVLVLMVAAANGCADEPQQKNRVPTVQAQLDEAQQAANDAKTAAASAQQTQKNIQDVINKLDNGGRNSDGTWKIGQPQISSVGVVTSVGDSKSTDGQTTNFTFWFVFAERTGFVKTFTPVCPNQSVPVNNTIILNFHWKEYENSTPGCYMIDGYTVVK